MLVKFFATYRDITKCNSCQLPAPPDVLVLLLALSERYGPALRERLLSPDGLCLGDDAIVMVNGRHITHLQGLATALTEDDVVAIFPLVAGG